MQNSSIVAEFRSCMNLMWSISKCLKFLLTISITFLAVAADLMH